MRYKLHVNRKKGKWEGAKISDLFKLLVKEIEELHETVQDGNQIATVLEAADVANYALMIAHVAMKMATRPEEEEEYTTYKGDGTDKLHISDKIDTSGVTKCQDSSNVNIATSPSSQGGQSSGLSVNNSLPNTPIMSQSLPNNLRV
jgi:NTP pyrophosphatase (non-canonical NTP hydrolase)